MKFILALFVFTSCLFFLFMFWMIATEAIEYFKIKRNWPGGCSTKTVTPGFFKDLQR